MFFLLGENTGLIGRGTVGEPKRQQVFCTQFLQNPCVSPLVFVIIAHDLRSI